jgi:aspartate/methionine/tyrosine aminotransferase
MRFGEGEVAIGLSSKASRFTESIIREMTRVNLALHGPERAINFAQGFPDFEPPVEIVEAAQAALARGGEYHQYATTWGAQVLREAIAAKKSAEWGRPVDPEREVTVACGATESMMAAMLAVVDPGNEVVVFEPFYENYGPDCVLTGARTRYVSLRPPDWRFDPDELRRVFTPRTRAIVINTPHNPTGKVFSREELELIAELCQDHDVVAITDEIYEHLVYEGMHVALAWPSAPSPSVVLARPIRSPAGAWAGWSRLPA